MGAYRNVLLICTDQQRADTLGCYGDRSTRTPNLDSLAEESFVFEHAYCAQPVCTPDRGSLLTGLYPTGHGATSNWMPLGNDVRTIAEHLGDEYVTANVGKWHLGDETVAQHGFDRWISLEGPQAKHYCSRPEYRSHVNDYHRFLIQQGFSPDTKGPEGQPAFSEDAEARMPREATKASFVADRTCSTLEELDERPFFLVASFFEPHPPFTGPYDDMYDPWQLEVSPVFGKHPPEEASLKHRLTAEYFRRNGFEGHDLTTEAGWRRILANYAGLATLVDEGVGKILSALEKSGHADDTVVVFTSDHGEMMGDHAMLNKVVLYEPSIRVPLLVRLPDRRQQSRRVYRHVSHVDIVPTLLEVLGHAEPEGLHGISFGDMLGDEPESLSSRGVVIQWNGGGGKGEKVEVPEAKKVGATPWRTVISPDRWKLSLSPIDRCELYDLSNDPHEQNNRFGDRDQHDRIAAMAEMIRIRAAEIGDEKGFACLSRLESNHFSRVDGFATREANGDNEQ